MTRFAPPRRLLSRDPCESLPDGLPLQDKKYRARANGGAAPERWLRTR
jgi:hypothetical protein